MFVCVCVCVCKEIYIDSQNSMENLEMVILKQSSVIDISTSQSQSSLMHSTIFYILIHTHTKTGRRQEIYNERLEAVV